MSGKLSDLGINFFLPVLIAAGFEWLRWVAAVVRRRPFQGLGRTGVTVACDLSAFYFTLLKSLPAFEQVHVGWLEFLARFFPVDTDFGNVTDPTDLLTLVTTVLAYRYLAQPSGTQTPRSQRASAGQ